MINDIDGIKDGYIIIPEDILEESASQMASEGKLDNSFQKMVDVIYEYKAANLTPIVLYNIHNNSMYCIVKELLGKNLH